jgi:hypothetical protein
MTRSRNTYPNSQRMFSSARLRKNVALTNVRHFGTGRIRDARRLQAANDRLRDGASEGMTAANSHTCWGCGERFFDDDLDHDMETCIEGGLYAFLCGLEGEADASEESEAS